MAVRDLEAVQQLSRSAPRTESRPGRIGPISLGAKQTGERSAGNPHAAFDEAGTGNVAWWRCCDTRNPKGGATGKTNFYLNQRANPRPYRGAGMGKGALAIGPKLPRPSSTLPDRPFAALPRFCPVTVLLSPSRRSRSLAGI